MGNCEFQDGWWGKSKGKKKIQKHLFDGGIKTLSDSVFSGTKWLFGASDEEKCEENCRVFTQGGAICGIIRAEAPELGEGGSAHAERA